ncbi:MAG: hypothetical protein JXJ20_09625 [Anaerolineae bacterium]|nr:hypothetical protein [Anaerolineae bacterium]
MRRSFLLIMFVILSLALAACGDDDTPSNGNTSSESQFGLFDWDRDPDTIIVRLDAQPNQENPAFQLNSIPPCTLWGDGRVVWTTRNETGAEEVLEARIDEVTMRTFLEDIINRGFYGWEDELIPPSSVDPMVETITVSLYDEVRTIRRYGVWPQSGFTNILEQCQNLSEAPVRVLPDAGWVSVYEVPRDTLVPSWIWPMNAPFSLRELAENGEARWIEGPLATEIWLNAREGRDNTQVVERDGSAYQIAIVVPTISRDAALPPSETETPDAES